MKIFRINIEFIILFLIFILLAILAILSNGYYEGADNISHYNISRYSFQHPYLFLDHWGKPFFTLLSSPFSQFGFKGLVFFNIICGTLTSYFSFRIAKELKYVNAYLICFFVTFSQYYFMMHLTALTEMLFSLVLIISVFLALRKKYLFAAILLSFLPFVRNEGFVIFPFFFFYFLSNKQYKQFPFMLTGFVLYSVIGYFYNHDILWLFHQNPYLNSAYGSGSYFHFLNNTDVIIGKPLLLLAIIGLLILVYYSLSKNKTEKFSEQVKAEWLLLVLPFLAYFAFHSYLWGKGIGGSLGLLRVMTGVAPLAAIISFKGFDFLLTIIEKIKFVKIPVIMISLAVIINTPFRLFQIPVKTDRVGALIKESAQWMKENNTSGERIYYYDPSFQPEFGFDPFSNDTNRKFFQLYAFPYDDIKINSLILWDAHFGTIEGCLSLDTIMKNKEFKLLKIFKPDEEIEIMGNKYKICVFKKIIYDEKNDNYVLEKSLE